MNTNERIELPTASTYTAGATEQLLSGGHLLRRAFLEMPRVDARHRGQVIITCEERNPPVLLVHSGFGYRCCPLADGRRAIVDLVLPGDVVGAEHAVFGRSNLNLTVASTLSYRRLDGEALRRLMAEPAIALRVLALAGENRTQMERHTIAITRGNAQERLADLLIDIHDRLKRAGLIARPTFNLPLTQEELGDYLGLTPVHVSRTAKRLREEHLVIVDRHVVIICDLDGLREIATGRADRTRNLRPPPDAIDRPGEFLQRGTFVGQ